MFWIITDNERKGGKQESSPSPIPTVYFLLLLLRSFELLQSNSRGKENGIRISELSQEKLYENWAASVKFVAINQHLFIILIHFSKWLERLKGEIIKTQIY